jgi:hypothetical protein
VFDQCAALHTLQKLKSGQKIKSNFTGHGDLPAESGESPRGMVPASPDAWP